MEGLGWEGGWGRVRFFVPESSFSSAMARFATSWASAFISGSVISVLRFWLDFKISRRKSES